MCTGIPTESQWLALLYILIFAAVVATFVSHTVASMILIPMVAQGELSVLFYSLFAADCHAQFSSVDVCGLVYRYPAILTAAGYFIYECTNKTKHDY
jgi:hypothetical protein